MYGWCGAHSARPNCTSLLVWVPSVARFCGCSVPVEPACNTEGLHGVTIMSQRKVEEEYIHFNKQPGPVRRSQLGSTELCLNNLWQLPDPGKQHRWTRLGGQYQDQENCPLNELPDPGIQQRWLRQGGYRQDQAKFQWCSPLGSNRMLLKGEPPWCVPANSLGL